MGDVKLNSTGGGSVTLTPPSTASNLTLTLPSASGTVATTSGTGSVFTNPTINGFTGDTSVINVGSGQFYKDTSGNVGIGTSSPSSLLTVNSGSGAAPSFLVNNTAAGAWMKLSGTASSNAFIDSSYGLVFRVNGSTTAATLDSSGNLGLGVTPSGWTSGGRIELANDKTITSQGTAILLGANLYYNAGFKYVSSNYSSYYQQNLGTHAWYTAPSGTAGNAISFTQAMTLDASGNLGIGTTSPGYRLDVIGSVRLKTGATGTPVIISTGGDSQGTLRFGSASSEYSINGGADYLALIFNTVGSERARIDSSGNLLLGTTSGSVRFYSYNASGDNVNYFEKASGSKFVIYNSSADSYVGTMSNTPLRFATNDTERARIDSSGNLLVGTTSGPTNARFVAKHSVANAGVGFIQGNSTSYTDSIFTVSSDTASGTGFNLLRLQNSGGNCLLVLGNGNVQNTNNSYGAISDQNLKENIIDATPKLADLLKVKIRNFNLIGDEAKQIGVVAQELEEIFPSMVEESNDGVKSVKYSVFTPMLVKAIQELSANNTELETRLAALEGK